MEHIGYGIITLVIGILIGLCLPDLIAIFYDMWLEFKHNHKME
jgi:hypothetical protein